MQMQRKRGETGGSIVEVALLAPWIFFLFVGVLDLGFYTYEAMSVQNAARLAAIQTAANPSFSAGQLQAMACSAAALELTRVSNKFSFVSGCGSGPLQVTQQTLNSTSTPACADCAVDTTSVSSLVTVTYQSDYFVPIPGILTGRLNLSRTSETRMVIP